VGFTVTALDWVPVGLAVAVLFTFVLGFFTARMMA